MAARITDIFSLLIITFLCVGLVEGGYQALEYLVLKPPVNRSAPADTPSITEDPATRDVQATNYDYRVILQRNLFGPPPGEGETVAPAPVEQTEILQPSSLNIVLMGTINGGAEADRAIILDKSSRKQELYEAGDAIQGAVIKEILRGKVILAYNGKDEMLDMSEAANVRPAVTVPVKRLDGGTNRSPITVSPSARQTNRQTVSPRGTPRRITSRPRAIRPSRAIRKQ